MIDKNGFSVWMIAKGILRHIFNQWIDQDEKEFDEIYDRMLDKKGWKSIFKFELKDQLYEINICAFFTKDGGTCIYEVNKDTINAEIPYPDMLGIGTVADTKKDGFLRFFEYHKYTLLSCIISILGEQLGYYNIEEEAQKEDFNNIAEVLTYTHLLIAMLKDLNNSCYTTFLVKAKKSQIAAANYIKENFCNDFAGAFLLFNFLKKVQPNYYKHVIEYCESQENCEYRE